MARPKPIRVFRERVRDDDLSGMLNLGPKSAAWLRDAGIRSVSDLRTAGPIEACRRIQESGQPVSLLMAYAIEGALTGCHWSKIPVESREWLRVEFAATFRTTIQTRPSRHPNQACD